jgi:hypothetical protein
MSIMGKTTALTTLITGRNRKNGKRIGRKIKKRRK